MGDLVVVLHKNEIILNCVRDMFVFVKGLQLTKDYYFPPPYKRVSHTFAYKHVIIAYACTHINRDMYRHINLLRPPREPTP